MAALAPDDLVLQLATAGQEAAAERLISIMLGGGRDADAAVAALARAVASGAHAAETSPAVLLAENAAATLHRAARSGAAARIAGAPAALPALVAALHGAAADPASAAIVGVYAAADAVAVRALLEHGCLAGLVAALGSGSSDQVVCSVSLLLYGLADSGPEAARRVGDCPGAVAALVAALQRTTALAAQPSVQHTAPDSHDVPLGHVYYASACLCFIAEAGPSSACAVAAAPGVFPALQAILTSGDDVAAWAAVGTLAALIPHAGLPAALEVSAAPMLSALVPAMASGSPRTATFACLAVSQAIRCCGFATGAAAVRRIATTAGTLPALVRAASGEERLLRDTAVEALANITGPGPQAARLVGDTPGAVGALAAALRRWGGDASDRLAYGEAALALGRVANVSAAHARLVAGAAPDMLELLTRALTENGFEAALGASLAVVTILSSCPELEARVCGAGALEACVELLRSAECADEGLDAMQNACCLLQEVNAQRCAAVPGMMEALARAAGCGKRRVAAEAALAFARIAKAAPEHARRLAASREALQALVALVESANRRAADVAASALREAASAAPSTVAAALATPAAAARGRAMLLQPPLSLPAKAAAALALMGARADALPPRIAALEALVAAVAGEAKAVHTKACAACVQHEGEAGGRLRPCTGCKGGPAGRVLYCGAVCQRADRARHRAYCKLAAAASVEAAAPAGGRPA
ncbi:hypothetical protein Rsub_07679 [Raphidocelis subcapitata]|uniref:MYND-type domain-containing protein n=1 Tax=Raphidocelis subcapitata TaxID=307507 RepID=A0A2V0PDC0_9CHLO|nr:hypothetical protein Rsub_07679 [Raphidocelis subcapitata]|eukprot:GBF95095.1 hypothetical protein Rsub_07679 [Raphidocelis subcapitata]